MAPPTTHLAWVDLETTGTSEHDDDIIEFAMILTDLTLQQVGDPFTSVVQPEHSGFMERISRVDAVLKMHTENGLIADVAAGRGWGIFTVDRLVDVWLDEIGVQRHALMLAGSGVGHFDYRFIRVNMPKLNQYLAYPVIDIGVIRRFIRDVVGRPDMVPAQGDGATKTHRALDDVKQHLAEARIYRTTLGTLFDDVTLHPLHDEEL